MRLIVICGLPRYTKLFLHYLTNGMIFEKKKNVNEHKMYVLILCTTYAWNISHSYRISARY
jgi:hypothetical protein